MNFHDMINIMKIILVRHTSVNENIIKGWTDIELSHQGQKEAAKLAKSLVGLGIDFIASSDLKRASETAEIINGLLHVPLKLDPRLRECSFGKIEGLTRQQAIEKYGLSITQNLEDNYKEYNLRQVGGENRADVLARHIEVIKSLSINNPNKTALIVGHQRGLFTLLSGLGYAPNLEEGGYKVIEFN
jgi:broad specificity phosphatase PhoE